MLSKTKEKWKGGRAIRVRFFGKHAVAGISTQCYRCAPYALIIQKGWAGEINVPLI